MNQSLHQLSVAVLLGIASLNAVSQVADPSSGTTVIKVNSQIVVLDVTVNDKDEHPVLNLHKEDFRVTEQGKPQSIRSFEPPSAHQMPSAGEVVRSSADLPKIGDAPVTLLVLDETNTEFTDMALARASLERYLKALPQILVEPTALLFVGNQKLDVIHDYTQDRDELLASLKKHFPAYPWQLTNNNGDQAMLPRMAQTLGALMQVAESTRGIRGRKNLIWVGKGFPALDPSGGDPDTVHAVLTALHKTTFALLTAKVTLFTVDPTALDPTPVEAEGSDSASAVDNVLGSPFDNQNDINFVALAPATGGTSFGLRNDVDNEVATSVRDGGNYYELSYAPTDESQDAAIYRKIRVTVDKPGLHAITRDGYYPMSADKSDTELAQSDNVNQVKFDLTSAAMSKLIYSDLPFKAEKDATGEYVVSIDSKGLDWREQGNGHSAEVSLMAVCFGAKDKPLFKTASEHTALTSVDNSQLAGRQVIYRIPVTVPNGTVRIRFVVRDLFSGRLGAQDVAVP